MVGIVAVIATMRSSSLSWSHGTCWIDGEVGSLSNKSVLERLRYQRRTVSGRAATEARPSRSVLLFRGLSRCVGVGQHSQRAFVHVEQTLLLVVLVLVHFSDLEDLAHDLRLETGTFGSGCTGGARRKSSCSTWIRARARPMASRKAAPTTGISAA